MEYKSKLINHFKVLGSRELKDLPAWIENQIGTRNAKVHTTKGFKKYVVEFVEYGKWKSKKQLKAIYGLLQLFYKSGCYSKQDIEIKDFEDLKKCYKKKVNLIDCYVYFNGTKVVEVKDKIDIPKNIDRNACKIILGSFSKITKKKATDLIGLLRTDMINSKIMQTSFGREFEMILQIMERC